MPHSENLNLPKAKLVTCNWCHQPIHMDRGYQHVDGKYFCNHTRDCLTAMLDDYARHKELENVQGDANVSS